MALRALWGRQAPLVLRAQLVLLAQLALRALPAVSALLVPMARQELPAQSVRQDPLVSMDLWVLPGLLALRAQSELLVRQASRARSGLPVR